MTGQRPDESVAEFVRRSREEQGLPATVTDPLVLRRVAEWLTAGEQAA